MLEFNLLGSFDAKRDEMPIEALRERHAARLLALLILEQNRSVPRSYVEAALGMSYDSLRKTAVVLRDCFSEEERERLKVQNNCMFLDLKDIRVDLLEFERCSARKELQSLEQAVNLYRGELLKGWDECWILEKREECQLSYLDALKTLAELAFGVQEYDRAASYLRRFLLLYPEMDSMWARLLEIYYHAENSVLAEQAYLDYCAQLEIRGKELSCAISPSQGVEKWLILLRSGERPVLSPKALFPGDRSKVRHELQSITVGGNIHGSPTAHDDHEEAETTETGEAAYLPPFEVVGGSVPLTSPYYLARQADKEITAAVAGAASFVLVRGARQIGKTSLLARALHEARKRNAQVIRTDWQNIPQSDLQTPLAFLLNVADSIADQLNLDVAAKRCFDPDRSPTRNFERFLRDQVFRKTSESVVWAIDEADRLFDSEYKDDVFGMMRSWHNERTLDPETHWHRVTIIMAYATDAYLISNIHQSPFNVGLHVDLHDFTLDQVTELNQRYNSPMSSMAEVSSLYSQVGGHPYLVRRSFQEMVFRKLPLRNVIEQAEQANGIYRDHLEMLRVTLLRDPILVESLRAFVRDGSAPSDVNFIRLCAAGVLTGPSGAGCRLRCRLYERFLRRALL